MRANEFSVDKVAETIEDVLPQCKENFEARTPPKNTNSIFGMENTKSLSNCSGAADGDEHFRPRNNLTLIRVSWYGKGWGSDRPQRCCAIQKLFLSFIHILN